MKQIAIKARCLIDGTNRTPIEDAGILVEQGRIKQVGHFEDLKNTANSEVLELSDLTLLPGLIDAHNHLSLDSSLDDYLQKMSDPLPSLALRASKMMPLDIKAGVTTIRCCGDKGFLDVACRQAVESDYLCGPRLVIAGKGIRSSAGYGYVGCPYDGPEEIRKAVRENIFMGADFIKFYVTGTVRGRGIPCFLSRDEIKLIVDEAARMRRKTAVHCIGGKGLEWCLEAGVDAIEHGYFFNNKEIELMLKYGTWLVMTPGAYFSEDRIRCLPQSHVEAHLRERDDAIKCMSAAIAAGIPYAVGTDGVHGKEGIPAEIAYLVELGAEPAEAIRAATMNASRVCGLEDVTGSLETGKDADIIAVNGNPLKDITCLADVKFVMRRGKVMVS